MQLRTYQHDIKEFAIYPSAGEGDALELTYLALGLNGEAGEVAEKVKKYIRDGNFDEENFVKELGDVFWYLTMLCSAVGIRAEDVLKLNYDKLSSRKERGVIGGSGDSR